MMLIIILEAYGIIVISIYIFKCINSTFDIGQATSIFSVLVDLFLQSNISMLLRQITKNKWIFCRDPIIEDHHWLNWSRIGRCYTRSKETRFDSKVNRHNASWSVISQNANYLSHSTVSHGYLHDLIIWLNYYRKSCINVCYKLLNIVKTKTE